MAHLGGDLGYFRLAAILLLQFLPRLHRVVGQITDGAADPHGVVVPQVALDLADDHRHAVGREPHVLRRVKVVDGLDEPDAPDLEQVVHILTAACEFLYDAEHQSQVALHHLLPGLAVTRAGRLDKAGFFGFAQHRQAGGIHAAEFYFSSIHPVDPQFLFTGSMGRYAPRQTGKFFTLGCGGA